jgi:hypothetical protein
MGIDKRFYVISTCVLLAALPGAASSLTSFDFTPATDSEFTLNLTDSLSSIEAEVTGTIACDSSSPCTGEVGSFAIGADFTSPTQVSAAISGTLTGDGSYGDSVTITSPAAYAGVNVFYIDSSPFDKTFFSETVPALGPTNIDGFVDLNLLPGQEIDLPITFTISSQTSPVPEPGTVFLLGGLLGALPLIRKARMKFSQTGS